MSWYYSPGEMRKVAIEEAMRRHTSLSSAKVAEFLGAIVPEKTPSTSVVFDIFLSYRSEDVDVVMGVYKDLVRRGYRIYLDRVMDPQLDRTNVNRNTADVLRNRLMQSKSLFYIATDNSGQSTWMPWELGFEDGYRGKSAVAPVTDKEKDRFIGNEFVAIYPRVVPFDQHLAIYDVNGDRLGSFEEWRDSVPKRDCGMPKCPLPGG